MYCIASSSTRVLNGSTPEPADPPSNLNGGAPINTAATTARTNGVREIRRSVISRTKATNPSAQMAIGKLLGLVHAHNAINRTTRSISPADGSLPTDACYDLARYKLITGTPRA